MRIWLIGAVSFLLACDAFLKLNPSYCDDSLPCGTGMRCDSVARLCVGSDGGGPLALAAVAPALSSRAGGLRVTLTGQGFAEGAGVSFEGVAATDVTFVSSTELQAIVPAGACGQAKVKVHNPDGAEVERASLFGYHLEQLLFTLSADINLDNDAVWTAPGLITPDPAIDLLVGHASTPSLQPVWNDNISSFVDKPRFGNTEPYLEGLVHDMDRDGNVEYIVRSATSIEVFRSTNGSSADRIDATSREMAIVDANRDGQQDIVTLSSAGDELVTYQQLSALNFGAQISIGLPINGKHLLVDDFNQDGQQDIAVTAALTPIILLCTASSMGTTSCTMTLFAVPAVGIPEFLGMVDTDNDGGKALAVITSDTGSATLSVLDVKSGTGTLLFQQPIGKSPTKLLIEDMDCDGLRDLILYRASGQTADIYPNLRHGNFAATATRISVPGGASPTSISVQIFNTSTIEELPDIVLLSNFNNAAPAVLRVYKNVSQ